MRIGVSKCSKCGKNLKGKHRAYRVRVKLPSGKWKSKTVPTMTMANKIELKYKTQSIEENQEVQFDVPAISEVWPEYLKWAKQNKRSWPADEVRYQNHIKDHIQNLRMNQVMPHHVQKVMNSMHNKLTPKGKPYAPATVKQIVTLIKRLFNWSIKQGYYQGGNPCNTIEIPTFDNTVTNPLSREGLKSLMYVLDSWKNERAVLITKFALYSGKRKREILSLTWDNIDFDNGLLSLQEKT